MVLVILAISVILVTVCITPPPRCIIPLRAVAGAQGIHTSDKSHLLPDTNHTSGSCGPVDYVAMLKITGLNPIVPIMVEAYSLMWGHICDFLSYLMLIKKQMPQLQEETATY